MSGRLIPLAWRHDPGLYAPARYRRACRYEAYLPAPLVDLRFSLSGETAGTVSDAESAISGLNAHAQPALAPLARLLLRTESIASSRIEGLQLGARELARAEAKAGVGQRVAPTALEVLANIDAMQLSVDNAARSAGFTLGQIMAIHTRLMAGAPNARRIAGRVRTTQNWIGGNDYNPCGADFVPPPPEYVPGLLDDLCAAMDDEVLPPLVQAALVHAQFETIHPFEDGNGRTGRALVQVVLRRRGLAPDYVPPISLMLANARDRYIAGLTSFREGHIEEWVEYFCAAAAGAARLAGSYLRRLRGLMDRWHALLAESPDAPRSDAAAWAILQLLPAHPVVTAPAMIAATDRSRASVYDAIRRLADAGVLILVSRSRRNQAWEVVGMLDLLAEIEGGGGVSRG